MKFSSNTRIVLESEFGKFSDSLRLRESLMFSANMRFMEHLDSSSKIIVDTNRMSAIVSTEMGEKSKMLMEFTLNISGVNQNSIEEHNDIISKISMDLISCFEEINCDVFVSKMDSLVYENCVIDRSNESHFSLSDIHRSIEYFLFKDSDSYNIFDFEKIEKVFDEDIMNGISSDDLFSEFNFNLKKLFNRSKNDKK